MIAFWIAAASLTLFVVAVLVVPLLQRPRQTAARRDYDLAVYRDQVAELERDLERGAIGAAEAEAAKAELARRMLAAARDGAADEVPHGAARQRNWTVAAAVAGLMPLAAVLIYTSVGRPDLPAQPLQARAADGPQISPEFTEAVTQLARRLEAEPNDAKGWVLLARSYMRLERPAQALDAWRRALVLTSNEASVLSGYGEALVMAGDGAVSDEARRVFESALGKAPTDPVAHYYLALGQAQAGDLKGALDRWTALIKETPADAPWLSAVRARITEVAQELKLDVAAVMPQPLPPRDHPAVEAPVAGAAGNAGAAGQGGPSRDQVDAAMRMSPAERQEMIRGMVANLAARLEESPADVDGWLRLARAYQMMGQPAESLKALERAAGQAPDRADVLVAYGRALMEGSNSGPDQPLPEKAGPVWRKVLELDPNQQDALWFAGVEALSQGRRTDAIALWERLLVQLDPKEAVYAQIKGRIDALKGG